MARPGLQKHPKFRRLVHMLQLPTPYVVGLLECLWEVAYESGNAEIGDATDVELAAQWPKDARDACDASGKLCVALLTCGGEGRAGFIEEKDGRYFIHDLFHHAPEYVMRRKAGEDERKVEKICGYCETPFFSSKSWAEFCSDACRKAHHRTQGTHGDTSNSRDSSPATHGDATPAPAPAPHTKEENTCAPGRKFTKPTIDEVRAYCLERAKGIDPEAWFDHYTANGWRVGKVQMKDWRATVRKWERNGFHSNGTANGKCQSSADKDEVSRRIREERETREKAK
jgi:hypothetical protein